MTIRAMHLDLSSLKKTHLIPTEPSLDNVLGQLYLFEWLDPDIRDSIVSRCEHEFFDSGVDILCEWDASNGRAYIILSGSVDILIGPACIARLGTGDIFGEYALICSEERTATVHTTAPTECLVLDEDALISVSNENNQINDIMIARINENAHQW